MKQRDDNMSNNRTEHLEYALSLVNYWIDKADAKVSISLGLFPLISAIMKYINSTYYHKLTCVIPFYEIMDILCVVLITSSIILFVFALKPNLKSSGKIKTKRYPIYYGDICRLDLDVYKSLVIRADENDYADELMNEIHCISAICYRKMVRFKVGVILSIMTILLEMCCFTLLWFCN